MRLSTWWTARGAQFAPRRSAAAAPSAPSSCSVRPPTSSWGLSPAPPPVYLKHDCPGGVSPSREGHPRRSEAVQVPAPSRMQGAWGHQAPRPVLPSGPHGQAAPATLRPHRAHWTKGQSVNASLMLTGMCLPALLPLLPLTGTVLLPRHDPWLPPGHQLAFCCSPERRNHYDAKPGACLPWDTSDTSELHTAGSAHGLRKHLALE